MKQIELGKAVVDIHDGPLGITLSGGVDSSLLLYILMKNTTDTIHAYTLATVEKNRTEATVAATVIGRCIDLTGNSRVIQHTQFVDKKSKGGLDDRAKEDFRNKKINMIYAADTGLYSDEVAKTFKYDSEMYTERDPNVVRPVYSPGGKFHFPFFNIHKQDIRDIYLELGIRDTLFPLTRSCDSLTLLEGHCGDCWACEERFWGFGSYS